MFPVLFRLGPFTFYTYTVLVDLGLAIGLGWLYLRADPRAPAGPGSQTRWLDAGIAATLGGLAGARLLYAAVNAGYYLNHLGEVFEIWLGGLAWPGALAGGLLGAWAYCRRRRESLWPLVDTLALPVALLAGLSWGGCLAASCAYGYEVAPGQLPAWMVLDAPDIYGLTAPRFPTQILGVIWSLIALAAVWGAKDRVWPVGARSAYALSLVALGAFLLGFTRGDPMPLVSGFRLDVVGSALVLLTSTAAWAWRVLRTRTPAQPQSESVANP